jgi:hypothetical protein
VEAILIISPGDQNDARRMKMAYNERISTLTGKIELEQNKIPEVTHICHSIIDMAI